MENENPVYTQEENDVSINLGGRWRWITSSIPSGFVALGTITNRGGIGVLVYNKKEKIYGKVITSKLYPVNQKIVADLVAKARAGKMGGAGLGGGVSAKYADSVLVRKQVTLDHDSINFLTSFGEGELSAGIRKAAKKLQGKLD